MSQFSPLLKIGISLLISLFTQGAVYGKQKTALTKNTPKSKFETTRVIDDLTFKISPETQMGGKAQILQYNHELWSFKLDSGHFYFGNSIDDTKTGITAFSFSTPSNENLAVMSSWSGGAHCCHTLYIFKTKPVFKNILELDGGNFRVIIKDVNNDKLPEVIFYDNAFAYTFTSFAGSPAPEIIMKLENGSYTLAPELMKKDYLPENEIVKMAQANVPIFENQISEIAISQLLSQITNLSYSGRHSQALKLIDLSWPNKLPGRSEFITKYEETLRKSDYWPKLNFSIK